MGRRIKLNDSVIGASLRSTEIGMREALPVTLTLPARVTFPHLFLQEQLGSDPNLRIPIERILAVEKAQAILGFVADKRWTNGRPYDQLLKGAVGRP